MKVTKIDSANATIEATIVQDEINKSVEKIAKQLSKTAKIDGFRKGKVPVSAVKKQYGEKLVEDAEGDVLKAILADALKEMDVDNSKLIGEPKVTKWEKTDEKIDVEIKIALRPEISIDDYSKAIPDVKLKKVTKKAVTERVQELAKAQAPFIDVDEDRALVDGDTAKLNFEGSVDGVVFEGGTAEDFSLTLGSKQFIPGFEDQVVGMKKDEEKVIKVTFPAEYGGKELAGKDAEFKVKINSIQTKEKVTMNAELAKKMLPGQDDATMEQLNDKVEEQLATESKGEVYGDLKAKLLDNLVNHFNFDLPEFVVEQEIDLELNKKAQSMSEDEIKDLRENPTKVDELRETFRADASRSVKATFIIDALAAKENIVVNEQEVMQTLYMEALQTGQDPQAIYTQYKDSGYLPAVQMSMVEDRLLTKILDTKVEAK